MTLIKETTTSPFSPFVKKYSIPQYFFVCLCVFVGVNLCVWQSFPSPPAGDIFPTTEEPVHEHLIPKSNYVSTNEWRVTNISNPSISDGFMFLFGSSPDTPQRRFFALQSSVSSYSFQTNRRIFYWCPIISHGQGNNVLHYWFARSVAFWLDMEFVQIYPGKYPKEKQEMEKIFSQMQTSAKIRHVIETKLMPECMDWNNKEYVKAFTPNFVPKARMKYYFETYSNKTLSLFVGELLANVNDKVEISKVLLEIEQLKAFLLHSMMVKSLGMNAQEYEEALKNKGLIEWMERTRNQDWFRSDLRYSWYQSKVMILYLHEVFRQVVVAPEMKRVWKQLETKWIAQSPKCKSGNSECDWQGIRDDTEGENDLVVHYRCGDIISSNVNFTGFLSLNYHREVLMYLFKRFGLTKHTKKKAFILFSIVDSKKDEKDQGKKNWVSFNRNDHLKCRHFFNLIKEAGFRGTFQDQFGYDVEFITSGTANEDTYRMSIAPFVICSVSTFCLHATLGSVNAKAIVHPTFNLASNFRDLLDGRNRGALGQSKWKWNFMHLPTKSDTYLTCERKQEHRMTVENLAKFVIDGTIVRNARPNCQVLVATKPDPLCGLSTILFTWSLNYITLARILNKEIWINYTSKVNKLFYDPAHGPNIWEYYLEPINPFGPDKCDRKTAILDDASTPKHGFWGGIHYERTWAIRPWPFGPIAEKTAEQGYNHTWFGQQRHAANKIVNEKFRWKQFLVERVNDFYEKFMKKKNQDEKWLGVHMRGSDKASQRRVVKVAEYWGYIMSWLKFHGIEKGRVFFATDDKNYLKTLQQMWRTNNTEFKDVEFNKIFISQQVTRSSNTTAVFNMRGVSKFDIGVEVLTDILLLAKCDCMLSSSSAVSEAAFYVNAGMHDCSVHLEYFRNRNEPEWAREGARMAEKLNVVVYRKPDFVD